MGQSEDVGVIPRFCDDMFSGVRSITAKDNNVSWSVESWINSIYLIWCYYVVFEPISLQIRFHIEMSYFEIYNEKIHDLLVSPALDADGEKKKQAVSVSLLTLVPVVACPITELINTSIAIRHVQNFSIFQQFFSNLHYQILILIFQGQMKKHLKIRSCESWLWT